jgi:hypothetical protein
MWWPERERDAAIVVVTRMAGAGYSFDDLYEMGRASKDLSDMLLISARLSEPDE